MLSSDDTAKTTPERALSTVVRMQVPGLGRVALGLVALTSLVAACLAVAPAPTGQASVTMVFPQPGAQDAPVFGPISLQVEGVATDEVQRSFTLDPPAPGKVDVEGDTVLFRPDWPGLAPGTAYQVRVNAGGAGQQTYQLTTAGRLAVTAVVPEDGASAVLFDTTVYVQFNRPVVPLTSLEAAPSAAPLQITPAAAGAGHWVNTGLYAFTPSDGWAPSTTYHLTVPTIVADNLGATLAAPYTFSFTTLPLSVATTNPPAGAQDVDPFGAAKVTFNQPADRSAAEAAFSLKQSGTPILGTFEWPDPDTLLFHPAQPLDPDTAFDASFASGAIAPPGADTATGYTWSFATPPLPAVTSTDPLDGGTLTIGDPLVLSFTSPMDRDDVRSNLAVDPAPDYPLYQSWSDDDRHLELRGALKPDTQYTVSLPAGTHDRFGRAISDSVKLTFTAVAPPPGTYNGPPQVWMIAPAFGTYDAYSKPQALVRTIDVGRIDYRLERLDVSSYLQATQVNSSTDAAPPAPGMGADVRAWSEDVQADEGAEQITSTDLLDESGSRLGPGYYRLIITTDAGTRADQRFFAVTHTALTVKEANGQILAWAVDLQSGQPVPNVPVRFVRPGLTPPLASAATDADGLAQAQLPPAPIQPAGGSSTPLPATFALLDRPDDAALGSATWNGGISHPSPWVSYLYTDRPIYRPGQTVHVKAIVRNDDDASFSVPAKTTQVTWTVQDSQARAVTSGTSSLSDVGTFSADLALADQAATGSYKVQVSIGPQVIGSSTFQVAEYQRPDFEVATSTSQTDVVSGDPLSAGVKAAYYFGAGMAHAPVRWRVSAVPFQFTWKEDPSFRFGDPEQATGAQTTRTAPDTPRAEGEGTTDATGAASFSVPTDVSREGASQRFTIESTVTGPDREEVSSSSVAVVHAATIYLGLKPTSFVAQAGQPASVALVALDPQGQSRPGVAVHVQVLRRTWLSVRVRDAEGELQWTNQPKDTLEDSLDVMADDGGRATLTFSPQAGGEYRIVAEATDESGHVAHSATSLWVSSSAYVPWQQTDDSSLRLQADKDQYQPGDVARIMVQAPVADALALVTVERGTIMSRSVQPLVGNSAVLEIPLAEQDIPNTYVSVTIFEGGDAPVLRTGTLELPVSSDEKRLQVTATPDRQQYAPGDTVTFSIRTQDASGQGVPAEVSLALVDEAVLALADNRNGDPVDAFWHRHPLLVRTGSTQSQSIDDLNQATSSGRKGGGGGDPNTVRENFPDTAFWQPDVQTDASGEASVTITLPDNLTTWRLTALAITADTHVGSGTSDVVVSKPLLLEPVAPRFVVSGDQTEVGATIHNTTTAVMHAQVTLHADGLTVDGDATQAVDVPASGETRVDWPVTVPAGTDDHVQLSFHADAGDAQDALQITLPLVSWGSPETVATAGEVGANDTTTEMLDMPDYADRTRGDVTVTLAGSLAGALSYSLRQVEELPFDSLEGTVSRFLPRLELYRAIDQAGAGDPLGLKDQLPGLVTSSVQRIYTYQHADGGWGWWQDDNSQPYLTAYALYGLVEAQHAGFTVDTDVVNRGAAFLRQWLNGDPGVYGVDTRAYALYVLGDAGFADPSRANALYDQRAQLGTMGKAYLAQVLASANKDDPRVDSLVAELSSQAAVSTTGTHWDEEHPNPWSFSTSTHTTAAVLDALVRLRPENPLIPSTVRWLMSARKDEAWETSQDTSASLLALTDYLVSSGELQGSFNWTVGLNGQQRQAGDVADGMSQPATSSVTLPVPELQVGQNQVQIARTQSGDGGRLYYTMQFHYFPPADAIPAISQGFSVLRQYLPLDGGPDAAPLTSMKVGDMVRVRVTVLAPHDLTHVVVEDPLPAGFEPMDPSLKITTAQASQVVQASNSPAGAWWRWSEWSHVDLRDREVALFATYLAKGTHEYTYLARAILPGTFRVLPTSGYEQYFPEVFARTDGRTLRIDP